MDHGPNERHACADDACTACRRDLPGTMIAEWLLLQNGGKVGHALDSGAMTAEWLTMLRGGNVGHPLHSGTMIHEYLLMLTFDNMGHPLEILQLKVYYNRQV